MKRGSPPPADPSYRELFDHLPVGIYRTTPQGEILAANPALAQMLGYSLEELVGMNAADLYAAPEERPGWLERIRAHDVVRGYPMRFRRRDGAIVWTRNSVRAIRGKSGDVLCYEGALEDLSEQKRAEQVSEEVEGRYRRLVEHSPNAIAVYAEGRIAYVNPATVRLLGAASADELLGKPVLDLVHPDSLELARSRMQRLLAEGMPLAAAEEKLVRVDGRTIDVEVTAIPTTYLGKPAVQVVVNDVTDRKRSDEELRSALRRAEESDRLKSAFLANMSHEIRTPLNVILGYGQLIESHLNELGDRSQRGLFEGMNRAGWRLMNTVHGVLDLSRLVSGDFPVQPVPFGLAGVVAHQVDEIRPTAIEKGLSVTLEIREPGARVVFDEYCLAQTLKQLLDNAVKFTSRGGITVEIRRDDAGTLEVEIRDTGVGIDRQHLGRLFTAFWQEESGLTRTFEGSGLGLALARRYLELNGASISAGSVKGEGSVFTIHLPTEAEANACDRVESPPAEATSVGRGRAAILVVEDDPDTQRLMQRILSKRYRVLLAATAAEARYLLGSYANEVRMILMDLSLKGAEDGLSLTRDLRSQERWRGIPIVATTAHTLPEDRQKALSAGCDAYLPKPLAVAELVSTVERFAR